MPPTLRLAAVALVTITAITGMLGCRAASSSAPSSIEALPSLVPPSLVPSSLVPSSDHGRVGTEDDDAVTQADGLLPGGVRAFDDGYPGVDNLDPDLLEALRAATADAADDGVRIDVDSGWRSPAYQAQLLREAIAEYGSAAAAARWVAPVGTSLHETGDAVDIGPAAATAWLSKHGARYGLCPVYRNEPWHYELRPAAPASGCPRMYADVSRDPRLEP